MKSVDGLRPSRDCGRRARDQFRISGSRRRRGALEADARVGGSLACDGTGAGEGCFQAAVGRGRAGRRDAAEMKFPAGRLDGVDMARLIKRRGGRCREAEGDGRRVADCRTGVVMIRAGVRTARRRKKRRRSENEQHQPGEHMKTP